MHDIEYIRKNSINNDSQKNSLMAFEICGKHYELSQYESAIEENEFELSGYCPLLHEFPYSIRNLRNEGKITQIPVYVIYNGEKFSLYDYFERNRVFEIEIPNIEEINGLEVKNEMSVKFTAFENDDDFYIVIINVYRIFQDLYNLFASARFALLNAQRILHLKSLIEWKDGNEQLWFRSVWLNNAIVFYNSCFDKLLQTIWIGCELYMGYKNKKMKNALCRNDLYTIDGLEKVYYWCNYNNIIDRVPKNLYNAIQLIYCDKTESVRQYANSIKHRGGLRYKNVFTFGQIYDYRGGGLYSSFDTRNEKEIDDVINTVKDYHIAFRELTLIVLRYVSDNFIQHGYLVDNSGDIKG